MERDGGREIEIGSGRQETEGGRKREQGRGRKER
jgi:hypothetical protein